MDTNIITANFDYNKLYNSNYYQKNKDSIAERKRLYYINNKHDILEKVKEQYYNTDRFNKIQCEFCHCHYNKKYITKHQLTNKCLKFQQQNIINSIDL